MKTIAVTGATGFIAQALMQRLSATAQCKVLGLCRRLPANALPGVTYLGEWERTDRLHIALGRANALVHCAGRAHVRNDGGPESLAEARHVNVHGSMNLARQAALAGVKRFLFISSIKVNGESTQAGHPFSASDAPAPRDAYGISKMEAEIGLRKIADETGMEVVIVRPPLVYGPGVKGNFAELMRWVARGIPLPLAGIENRRSFVALDNLVDLLLRCVDHPGAAHKTFLVSDGDDLSTPDLLRRLAAAMGRPSRLFPLPEHLLRGAATLMGRGDAAARLCESLQVDMTATRKALDWSPPIGVDEGLRRAAHGFRASA